MGQIFVVFSEYLNFTKSKLFPEIQRNICLGYDFQPKRIRDLEILRLYSVVLIIVYLIFASILRIWSGKVEMCYMIVKSSKEKQKKGKI